LLFLLFSYDIYEKAEYVYQLANSAFLLTHNRRRYATPFNHLSRIDYDIGAYTRISRRDVWKLVINS